MDDYLRGREVSPKGKWTYSGKKIALSLLAVAIAVGIGLGGRFAYNILVPSSAFAGPAPTMTEVPMETPTDEYSSTASEAPSLSPSPTPTPTPDPYAEALQAADGTFTQQRTNIILIGIDRSPDRESWIPESKTRSDVMCILSIDFANSKVDMINIPRDSYLQIYKTTSKWKANAAYMRGGGKDKNGFLYVMKTAETAMGGSIPIPYYCAVDMAALKELVEAVGGVDYNVDHRIVMNGRVLEKGFQHLNGQQVLDYCRARKGIDNDLGRITRQQNILVEIFKQMKSSAKLANLPKIIQAMQGKVYTNISFEQMCALAVFGSKLPDGNIGMHQLPGAYADDTAYNAKYYLIDQKKKTQLIREIYGTNVKVKTDKEHDRMYVLYDWAQLQGRAYVTYVNRVVEKDMLLPPEQQKLTPENRVILQDRVAELQNALNNMAAAVKGAGLGDKRYQTAAKNIDAVRDDLKTTADGILKPLGIKISWHVQSDGDTDDQ